MTSIQERKKHCSLLFKLLNCLDKVFFNFGNRTLLCSDRAEQLIFCHDNFKNLAPHVKKWKTDMKAFEEEDKAKAAEAAKVKETQGEINK